MFRILVVDDEPMIRKGLRKLIQDVDPSITYADTADNGIDALNKMAIARPDILFTDIKMPKMDGLELCRQVSELYPNMPIVVITGYGDFEYARQCMSYGVKEYMLKPVTKTGVLQMVKKLLELLQTRRDAFIPLSVMENWLDRLQAGIWHLQPEAIEQAISDMQQHCASGNIDLPITVELIRQLADKLTDKLNAKDVYPFLRPSMTADQEMLAFTWLKETANGMMEQLRVRRRGNFKDPVEEAKSYMEQNLSRELSLEEVADKLGLNHSYFSQLFKQMTNETFVQYRTKRRMEKAKQLLSMPHLKITDVSAEVGYMDHPHFTKTFKKYSGLTPSEYRGSLGIRG